MPSKKHGNHTSKPEVTHISRHGFWLLVKDQEYFMPFKRYPWFLAASLAEILSVKLLHLNHLRWPKLDVDLELESLIFPQQYPLIDKKRSPRKAAA